MATHAYEETREPYRKGEPREPYRKGDRSTTMGHTRFQGGTRRERTLEASRRQEWASRIRTSNVPGGHHRQDSRGRAETDATKKGQENNTEEKRIGGRIGQEGERRRSYSAAVINGIKRDTRSHVGDSIIRKTDSRLSKGEDAVVYLPGARIEHVTERVEKIVGRGNGGTIPVNVGTNNAEKEGTTAIVEKYRNLLKKTKQAGVGPPSCTNYWRKHWSAEL